MCAGFRDCDSFSIANRLVLESNRPEISTIALAPALWFDDMVKWLDPELETCCRIDDTNGTRFCDATEVNRDVNFFFLFFFLFLSKYSLIFIFIFVFLVYRML